MPLYNSTPAQTADVTHATLACARTRTEPHATIYDVRHVLPPPAPQEKIWYVDHHRRHASSKADTTCKQSTIQAWQCCGCEGCRSISHIHQSRATRSHFHQRAPHPPGPYSSSLAAHVGGSVVRVGSAKPRGTQNPGPDNHQTTLSALRRAQTPHGMP